MSNTPVSPGASSYPVGAGTYVRVFGVARYNPSQADVDTALAHLGLSEIKPPLPPDWPDEPGLNLSPDERLLRAGGTLSQQMPTRVDAGSNGSLIFFAVWIYQPDASVINPAPSLITGIDPTYNINGSTQRGGPDLDSNFWPQLASLAQACYGVPQEWLLRIFYLESTLNPHIGNSLGFCGLNQIASSYLRNQFGVQPSEYLTWSASKQVSDVISKWYPATIRDFLGRKPRSIGALYALNLAPGIVKARGDAPEVILYQAPDNRYVQNSALDRNRDGAIRISDLDVFLDNDIAKRGPYINEARKIGGVTPPSTVPIELKASAAKEVFLKLVLPIGAAIALGYYLKDHIGFNKPKAAR